MPGGIPMADIAAYCHLFEIADPGLFVRRIREMDAEFLRFAEEKSKASG